MLRGGRSGWEREKDCDEIESFEQGSASPASREEIDIERGKERESVCRVLYFGLHTYQRIQFWTFPLCLKRGTSGARASEQID